MKHVMMFVTILMILAVSTEAAAQEATQPGTASTTTINEMKWFEPVVGEWNLEEMVQLSLDSPIMTSKKMSKVYFLPDGKTFVFEDISLDGNNHFLSFHAYDTENEQYINWGAASNFYEGWGHGYISEDGQTYHLSVQGFDPRKPDETGHVFILRCWRV